MRYHLFRFYVLFSSSIDRSQRNGISNPLHTIIIKYLDQLMWCIEERKQQLEYDSCQCNFTAQCPPMNQTCVKRFFLCVMIRIRAYFMALLTMVLLLFMRTVRSKVFFFTVIGVLCLTPMTKWIVTVMNPWYTRILSELNANIFISFTSRNCRRYLWKNDWDMTFVYSFAIN